MDCCYAHCACCARRPRTRERPRRLYFFPLVFVEEDDYEREPLYLHPSQYFPPRRSRTRSRRAKEEEEEETLKSPSELFYFEENARKKTVRKNSQEEKLQSLAHRLDALEVGLRRLTAVRNSPTPQKQRIARSSPPTDDFPNPPRSETGREKFSKKKSFATKPEEAAVIIQSRFRAHLVRRSQTLRHLRDLATVKSALKELRCLYADSRYRRLLCRDADERNLFSERATALLLKLDSIQGQGCEGMVREVRRDLGKDLVTLLDGLDEMVAQPRVDKEDIKAPVPAADEEEETEGWSDWRAPPSERRYFPRPLSNTNRGRHMHRHGPGHCRSRDLDASGCDNSKTRIPIKCRKRFGRPVHLRRGIYDMDEVGFETYCSSAALPFWKQGMLFDREDGHRDMHR